MENRSAARAVSLSLVLGLLCSLWATVSVRAADPALAAKGGYEGRIRLVRFLDEPDGYCFDVPGPVGNRFTQFPLVAHTCHFDPLADQVFEFNTRGSGQLRWTYEEEDLCFEALGTDSGVNIDLRACGASAQQRFEYTGLGEFKLVGSELCIHVEKTGPGIGESAGEGQDRYGRGNSVNAQFTHLMRRLELRTCGTEDPSMSRWQSTD
ncbi:MAG: ricin-type beta-trefoil lectin domain protein [Pseudomonadota bacterium]